MKIAHSLFHVCDFHFAIIFRSVTAADTKKNATMEKALKIEMISRNRSKQYLKGFFKKLRFIYSIITAISVSGQWANFLIAHDVKTKPCVWDGSGSSFAIKKAFDEVRSYVFIRSEGAIDLSGKLYTQLCVGRHVARCAKKIFFGKSRIFCSENLI